MTVRRIVIPGTKTVGRFVVICSACEEVLSPGDEIDFGKGVYYCDECLPATVTSRPMGLILLPLKKPERGAAGGPDPEDPLIV